MKRRWIQRTKELVIICGLFVLAVLMFGVTLWFNQSTFGRERADVTFGVTFSKLQAESIGLDWKKTYIEILDDLNVNLIRLPVYWNEVEPTEGEFVFDHYVWMVEQAQQRNVKVIPVLGMRVPRWPECHIPEWAQSKYQVSSTRFAKARARRVMYQGKEQTDFETTPETVHMNNDEHNRYLQSKILTLLKHEVDAFKHFSNILYWQVENEALLGTFGECPFTDQEFLSEEFAFVRKLDPARPLMGTESGEMSSWLDLANISDVLGVSLYRVTFNPYLGFFYYPIPPLYYQKKAEYVNHLVPQIMISELQAEPWVETSYPSVDVSYLNERFPLDFLRRNVSFARKTQFDVVLLWGVEWWEYMRERGAPEYWEYAKTLF